MKSAYLSFLTLLPCLCFAQNEITVFGAAGANEILADEAIAFMNAFPGTTVRVRTSSTISTTGQEYLFNEILGKNSSAIDVFIADCIWPPLLVDHTVDVMTYPELASLKPRMLSGFWDSNVVGLKTTGIPWGLGTGVFYYRKDLIQKYFNHTNPPATWDEMEHMALVILRGETLNPRLTGYVFQGKAYESSTCNIVEWFASHGMENVIDSGGQIHFNSPQVIEALARVQRWTQLGISPANSFDFTEIESDDKFVKGNAIFARTWMYATSVFSVSPLIADKFGVAKLPGKTASLQRGSLGGYSLAISRYSRNPDLAAKFLAFTATTPIVLSRDAIGQLSPLKDVMSVCNRTWPDGRPNMPVTCDTYPLDTYITSRPSMNAKSFYPDISERMFNSVSDMLLGTLTPEQAAISMECRTIELLQGANRLPERCQPQCPAGQYRSGTRCSSCSSGRYSPVPNLFECLKCAPGNYSGSTGATSCMECPPGTYQDRAGQDSCINCKLNTYSVSSSATECERCPTGTSNSMDFLVREYAAGIVANYRPKSKDLCLPIASHYGLAGQAPTACVDGMHCCRCYNEADVDGCGVNSRANCSESVLLSNIKEYGRPCKGECVSGTTVPLLAAGWYDAKDLVSGASGLRPIKCEPEEVCLGGTMSSCLEGSEDVRCGKCAAGYFKDSGGTCSACGDNGQESALSIILLVVLPIVLGAIFLINASKIFRVASTSIFVDWAQIMSVVLSISIKWPTAVNSLESCFSPFNFNLRIIPISCASRASNWGFFDTWLLQMFAPVILIGGALCIFVGHKVLKLCRPSLKSEYGVNTLINTVFICLTTTYTIVTKNVFELFRCVTPGGDAGSQLQFMATAPYVMCRGEVWNKQLPIAIVFLVFVSLGVPIFLFALLFRVRHNLSDAVVRDRFGSLFMVYQDDSFWWICVAMTRRFICVIMLSLFSESPLIQICVVTLVIFYSLVLLMIKKPFRHPEANMMQFWVNVQSVMVMVGAFIYQSESSTVTEGHRTAATVIIWAVSVVVALLLIRGLVAEYISYHAWKHPNTRVAQSVVNNRFLRNFMGSARARHWALAVENRRAFNSLTLEQRRQIFPAYSSDALVSAMCEDKVDALSDKELLKGFFFKRHLVGLSMWLGDYPSQASAFIQQLKAIAHYSSDLVIASLFNKYVEMRHIEAGGEASPFSVNRETLQVTESALSTPRHQNFGILNVGSAFSSSPRPFEIPPAVDAVARPDIFAGGVGLEDIIQSYVIDIPGIFDESDEEYTTV